MIPSDAELVRQALSGSQPAYQTLVSRYAKPAVNLAARMVQDRALAEDLAQEAFLRAFEGLRSYDPKRRFVSWFFQILHNVTVDYLRQKRPVVVALDGNEATNFPAVVVAAPGKLPDRWAEEADLARDLDAALDRLRSEYREAVILHYREELSIQEVADAMRLPEGTVKTYLYRARQELAAMLSARGWAPKRKTGSETVGKRIS